MRSKFRRKRWTAKSIGESMSPSADTRRTWVPKSKRCSPTKWIKGLFQSPPGRKLREQLRSRTGHRKQTLQLQLRMERRMLTRLLLRRRMEFSQWTRRRDCSRTIERINGVWRRWRRRRRTWMPVLMIRLARPREQERVIILSTVVERDCRGLRGSRWRETSEIKKGLYDKCTKMLLKSARGINHQ